MSVRDLTGRVFGRLVVMGRSEDYTQPLTGKKSVKWSCKCSCGNNTSVRGVNLISGNTRSCGCLHREAARERRLLAEGEASFNIVFSRYKRRAEKTGLSFSLSEDTFKGLTKGNCVYCGVPPEQVESDCKKSTPYIYNGVDRVDNTKGYEEGNVVSCCGFCNFAKSNYSQEEFLSKIKSIYENLTLQNV